ncbi:hypothetical protein XI05_18785 [Bradyrhizobium sp. CCBAU 11357]|nr:hypothetical protein [Bradyrhizobium sp. CCBAU 11357]
MRKLRTIGCIISERRGALEVHRTRVENVACEWHDVMRQRIARMDEEELSSRMFRICNIPPLVLLAQRVSTN